MLASLCHCGNGVRLPSPSSVISGVRRERGKGREEMGGGILEGGCSRIAGRWGTGGAWTGKLCQIQTSVRGQIGVCSCLFRFTTPSRPIEAILPWSREEGELSLPCGSRAAAPKHAVIKQCWDSQPGPAQVRIVPSVVEDAVLVKLVGGCWKGKGAWKAWGKAPPPWANSRGVVAGSHLL